MSTTTLASLEASVLPVTEIVIKDESGEKKYKLVLDFNAIAKAQDIIKRDLAQVKNWFGLSGPDLSVIVWSALDRYHPEVELKEVRRWLAPVQFFNLYAMLIEQAYPGILERMNKAQEEEEKRNSQGGAQPNPPTPENV